MTNLRGDQAIGAVPDDEWDPAFCRQCGWLDCECPVQITFTCPPSGSVYVGFDDDGNPTVTPVEGPAK